MRILIDHKIRIHRSELSADIEDSITEALSIPNIKRQKAMEQGFWGWQKMPETINLWYIEDQHLVMPRGFLHDLRGGLESMGVAYEILDQRIDQRIFDQGLKATFGDWSDLYDWQKDAATKIIVMKDGIWKSPAGSGKTITILGIIRSISVPAIVLVGTKDILYQWRKRAREFLGDDYPVGLIGDGHFEISDYLTIASVKTLDRRFDNLEESGFFDEFSFMCLDECHHATAANYNKIVNRFSSKYRIGISATPDKTGDFTLATMVLGPIIHETKRSEVDSIIAPVIIKVSTEFSFKYIGKSVFSRSSNYPELLDKITSDQDRNKLIAKTIMLNQGHHCLVVSKRLNHLDYLADELEAINYPDPIFTLTGKESSGLRTDIIKYVSETPCVVFSTLADEAMDIPRLDRLFLVFPHRNQGLIEQQVGRVCRSHPNKKDAIVFDFADLKVGPLEVQWKIRSKVYRSHKYKMSYFTEEQIMSYEFDEDWK